MHTRPMTTTAAPRKGDTVTWTTAHNTTRTWTLESYRPGNCAVIAATDDRTLRHIVSREDLAAVR